MNNGTGSVACIWNRANFSHIHVSTIGDSDLYIQWVGGGGGGGRGSLDPPSQSHYLAPSYGVALQSLLDVCHAKYIPATQAMIRYFGQIT